MNTEETLFSAKGITDSTRMLHTPGDFARKHLLFVQEVGKLKSLKPHQAFRENLDSFLILGVLEGEGRIEIRGKEHRLQKGDCVFLNCMERYMHESSEDHPWKLMWVHFNGVGSRAYHDLFLEKNHGCSVFRPESLREAEQLIEKMMEQLKKKDLSAELECGSTLIRLINNCLFSVMKMESPEQEQELRCCARIREYVNTNFKDQDLLQQLAKDHGQSQEALNAVFHRVYGIDLQDYILNRRFTAAKELLRFTIRPVSEIQVESGIINEDLFRRLFKESEGMSAEEYRMKWAQWIK